MPETISKVVLKQVKHVDPEEQLLQTGKHARQDPFER